MSEYVEDIPKLQEGRSPSDHKNINNIFGIVQNNVKSPVISQGDGTNTKQLRVATFTLAGSETQLQLEEDASLIHGSLWFTANKVPATAPTSLAINGSDASKIDITGSVVAGACVILYN